MKKCPFCAEMIQDEAIKCRYCQSFLTDTPPPMAVVSAAAAAKTAAEPGAEPKADPAAEPKPPATTEAEPESAESSASGDKSAAEPEPTASEAKPEPADATPKVDSDDYWSDAAAVISPARATTESGVHKVPAEPTEAQPEADANAEPKPEASASAGAAAADDDDAEPVSDAERERAKKEKALGESREKGVLYSGAPSWKAYFWEYFYAVLATLIVPFISHKIANWQNAKFVTHALAILIPVGLGVLFFMAITWYRHSRRIRITTKNIETEYGFISKKIDVLELWRCHDIRYRQSIWDRILRISYIDIFTAETEEPHLTLQGMPSSRQLFERIRENIESQRKLYGVSGP